MVGGLSTHQALQILQHLKGIQLVGMDVVEVAPAYDVGDITSLAAATIALHQLCLLAWKRHHCDLRWACRASRGVEGDARELMASGCFISSDELD